jgi:hypothetical protein
MAGGGNLLHDACGTITVDIGDLNQSAGFGQSPGGRPADAAGGGGDQRDPAGERGDTMG